MIFKLERSGKRETPFLAVVLFLESLFGIRYCLRHFVYTHSFSLYKTPVRRVLLLSVLQMRKLGQRMSKRLSQLT